MLKENAKMEPATRVWELRIKAAAHGGFTVWKGGFDGGYIPDLLFAGTLPESLEFMRQQLATPLAQ